MWEHTGHWLASAEESIRKGKKKMKTSLKSVQSALSDLLTTSATHDTFCLPSTKRGLILIGLELNSSVQFIYFTYS